MASQNAAFLTEQVDVHDAAPNALAMVYRWATNEGWRRSSKHHKQSSDVEVMPQRMREPSPRRQQRGGIYPCLSGRASVCLAIRLVDQVKIDAPRRSKQHEDLRAMQA